MAMSEPCAGAYHALLGPYWVRAGTFLNSFPARRRGDVGALCRCVPCVAGALLGPGRYVSEFLPRVRVSPPRDQPDNDTEQT